MKQPCLLRIIQLFHDAQTDEQTKDLLEKRNDWIFWKVQFSNILNAAFFMDICRRPVMATTVEAGLYGVVDIAQG